MRDVRWCGDLRDINSASIRRYFNNKFSQDLDRFSFAFSRTTRASLSFHVLSDAVFHRAERDGINSVGCVHAVTNNNSFSRVAWWATPCGFEWWILGTRSWEPTGSRTRKIFIRNRIDKREVLFLFPRGDGKRTQCKSGLIQRGKWHVMMMRQ